MKLRVLFLRKIHILYALLGILTALILLLFLNIGSNLEDVFATVKDKTLLKLDLTGDGKEDLLYINTEDDKYYLQVNVKDTSYNLTPDTKKNTFGYYYSFNPMRINLLDITRDRTPEIFIQSSEKGFPLQQIFTWTGTEFKDIFCSSNNIMGIIDSKNNKTPKFISGLFVNNSYINTTYYMFLNGKMEKIQYSDDLQGKNEIIGMINYVQSLPSGESLKPSDIFYPNLTGKDLVLIGKMASENKYYKFTNGFFLDSKYNKDGEPLEYKWLLNFKATPVIGNSESESFSMIVKLKRTSTEGNPYKIYFIGQNIN